MIGRADYDGVDLRIVENRLVTIDPWHVGIGQSALVEDLQQFSATGALDRVMTDLTHPAIADDAEIDHARRPNSAALRRALRRHDRFSGKVSRRRKDRLMSPKTTA